MARGSAKGSAKASARGLARGSSGGAGDQATSLTDWYLIAEGDSITAGTEPPSYARQLPALYSPEPGLSVPAVGGTNQTQMEARFTASVQGIIEAEIGREMVIVSVLMSNGLIEFFQDVLYPKTVTYWENARNAGAKVLACTYLPRSNAETAPGWSDGDPPSEFNALTKRDPSLYDELCDFAAEDYGQVAAATDPLQYSDGVHPTPATQALMLVTYKAAIDRLISLDRPVNTVLPAITGTLESGQTVTCSTGTWTNSGTFSYQWFREDLPISGATSSTYQLAPADVDSTVKCNVKCTNAGIGVWIASAYTATIGASYGSEILTNGTFDSNITGWPVANGAILTWQSGQLQIEAPSGGNSPGARPTWTAENGSYYRLSYDVTLGVNSLPFMALVADSGYAVIPNRIHTTSGSGSIVFQANSTNMILWLRGNGPVAEGSTWLVDNVSIKKIL